MSYSIKNRMAHLEQQAQSEHALIAQNRQIILSMVEDFVRFSSRPPEESRQFFLRCLPPELAAHLADDWETNPLTLETLRILSLPDGNLALYEKTLERAAAADGLETNELVQLMLLDSRFKLEQLLVVLRIAYRRNLSYVLVNLHGKDPFTRAQEVAQRHAEIDRQAHEQLAAKEYTDEEIERIITDANELRAKFWATIEPDQLEESGVCDVCGAAQDIAAKLARKFGEFAQAEGFSPAQ
jgi:hypothetical protein